MPWRMLVLVLTSTFRGMGSFLGFSHSRLLQEERKVQTRFHLFLSHCNGFPCRCSVFTRELYQRQLAFLFILRLSPSDVYFVHICKNDCRMSHWMCFQGAERNLWRKKKRASIHWDLLCVKHPAECFTYLSRLILITPLRGWYEWLY